MKINSILIGKGSGSAGNVTVLQLKGQTILKQKATIVSNPRTEKQVEQRRMINRAVFIWQLLGGVLKQGWSSLLPYCSQFNTYVSVNAQFFKNADFTKENMVNEDVIGSVATKGSLGTLNYTLDAIEDNQAGVYLSSANLNQIAKEGDKIVLLIGPRSASAMEYSEVPVTAALLAAAQPVAMFPDISDQANATAVSSVFVVSADGKNSSTSIFNLG